MSRMGDVGEVMLEGPTEFAYLSNARVALGGGKEGLGVPCAYCLPSLVTAFTTRNNLPCCHQCAGERSKPRVPAFVLKERT